MADDWVVLTSCFFPSRRPIRFLEVSAALCHASPLRTYGDGEQYANWTQMKVNRMIPELERLKAEGFTHYLYTDGRDAFFTRPFSYILAAYESLGRPDGLLSGHDQPFTLASLGHHNNFLKPAKYRFHCCGGYLGRIDYWLETHRKFVRDDYESRPTGGDEAGVWQWAWADGWFRPQIDTGCAVWQNLGGCEVDVVIDNGGEYDLFTPEQAAEWERVRRERGPCRVPMYVESAGSLHNKLTQSYPALLHFTGYCKDPVYGVYDAMKPWWDALYPNYPIGKEEIVP